MRHGAWQLLCIPPRLSCGCAGSPNITEILSYLQCRWASRRRRQILSRPRVGAWRWRRSKPRTVGPPRGSDRLGCCPFRADTVHQPAAVGFDRRRDHLLHLRRCHRAGGVGQCTKGCGKCLRDWRTALSSLEIYTIRRNPIYGPRIVRTKPEVCRLSVRSTRLFDVALVQAVICSAKYAGLRCSHRTPGLSLCTVWISICTNHARYTSFNTLLS